MIKRIGTTLSDYAPDTTSILPILKLSGHVLSALALCTDCKEWFGYKLNIILVSCDANLLAQILNIMSVFFSVYHLQCYSAYIVNILAIINPNSCYLVKSPWRLWNHMVKIRILHFTRPRSHSRNVTPLLGMFIYNQTSLCADLLIGNLN